MIRRRWSGQRYGWIAASVIGYAILAHYTNLSRSAKPLGAILAIAPALALGLGLAWRSAYRAVSLALVTVTIALICSHWKILESNYPLLYLLEEMGFYALLSITFARSLVRGRIPLCTYWAENLHGPLPAVVASYTRTTTAAWGIFFALIATLSLAMYLWSPLPAWSAFSNFATLPLVVLMFIGEYTVRRKVLPPPHRTGLWESVRACLDSSRHTTAVGQ